MAEIRYKATPTLARFHASDSFVRGVIGPIGSGKSVAGVMELWRRAMLQDPDEQGVRRTRAAVIRNTYPELKATTINTFMQWVPFEMCPIVYGAPIEGRLRHPLSDGTTVECQIYFLSLDKRRDVKKLESLELTFAYINEARHIPLVIFETLLGRMWRYPKTEQGEGGASWSGVWFDTNPPSTRHWIYHLAEEKRPQGMEFFRQPPAVLPNGDGSYRANPRAENAENHKKGHRYWLDLVPMYTPEQRRVMLENQYGSVFDGRPVYQDTWSDSVHVEEKGLEILRGLPLLIGWDFGLTPAAVIAQVGPNGQLRVLRDPSSTGRCGIRQFARDVIKPLLASEFSGMSVERGTGDPAGVAGSQADSDVTCFSELALAGLPADPAPTNDFELRVGAVDGFLTTMAGGTPAFLLDPCCTMLREGFNGGYHFPQVNTSGQERYRDRPDKNEFSHPHDALQYLCLKVDRNRGAVRRETVITPAPRVHFGGFV